MKIAVLGASGRMGQSLAKLASAHGASAFLGISRQSQASGYQHIVAQLNGVTDDQWQQVDVIIDFSLPEAFSAHASLLPQVKKPFISGVTGLDALQQQQLQVLAKDVPCFWSPNFSLGIAVFKKCLSLLATLSDFDFQLEETHHIRKKDAPSGTALYLQQALQQVLPAQKIVPPPLAIRGGGVVGDHRLHVLGEYEKLVIEHQALDRQVFASGALKVSHWLSHQPPGFYTMDDYIHSQIVVGLNQARL